MLNAGAATYRSQIYALTVQGAGGLSAGQQQARAAINELRGRLVALTLCTSGEIAWAEYQYSALAAFSQPVDPGPALDPTGVRPNRLEWPLGDLGTFGVDLHSS